MKLEERLEERFQELNIPKDDRIIIGALLFYVLKEHDEETYKHSVRVGLLCAEISEYLRLDTAELFYAGLLHDIGKTEVDAKILNEKDHFTDEYWEKTQQHTIHGHNLLKKTYPFTAEIVVRHHRYQENPYPDKLPKSEYKRKWRKQIKEYSKILALTDFYDALTTRHNKKFDNSNMTYKEIMLKHRKDQSELIEQLFSEGILS